MTTIRPFAVTDTDEIVKLWEECGLVRPWNDPRKDIERKLRVQPELFLVAQDAAAVVGSVMAGFDGHRGWIYYLAVAASHQRRSLGRDLMQQAERLLVELGCPKVNLMVRSTNVAVVGFYRRLGYEQDDVVSLGKRLIADA
ncbi:MAG: GNAT family acetyltransferase [Trueperaceae bacterium]